MHHSVEVVGRPLADAGLVVRRDVGDVEIAERRGHRPAARELLAVGVGVAGDAIARAREIFAALIVCVVGFVAAAGAVVLRQHARRRVYSATTPATTASTTTSDDDAQAAASRHRGFRTTAACARGWTIRATGRPADPAARARRPPQRCRLPTSASAMRFMQSGSAACRLPTRQRVSCATI